MNLTWKTKLAAVVALIAVIAGLLLVIKYQRDIIAKQEIIQKSIVDFKQLPNNVVRSETQYVTPDDLNKFADSLDLKLGPIKDDLKSLNAHIQGIQTVTVKSSGENKTDIASTSTETRTGPIPANEPADPYNYRKNEQKLSLEEPFGKTSVPIGEVSFKAWEKTPWTVNLPLRTYSVISVLGQDENGKHYTYSKFNVVVAGKSYDVQIDNSKFEEELPTSKFRFNPQLYAGFSLGTYLSNPSLEFMPNLELSLFSYSQTKMFPDWIFINPGFGYMISQKQFALTFNPASYNIGKYLPFVENIYIGPDLAVDVHGNFSILGGIKVGL